MNVYRSNRNVFVQMIDDIGGRTLISCSTIDKDVAPTLVEKNKIEAAKIVGQQIAERARVAGITTVVFDRGGFKYSGRVAAVAQGAREAGLEF
jgi:large subunit ribosomal protein L18